MHIIQHKETANQENYYHQMMTSSYSYDIARFNIRCDKIGHVKMAHVCKYMSIYNCKTNAKAGVRGGYYIGAIC